jgi:hypothetical protein
MMTKRGLDSITDRWRKATLNLAAMLALAAGTVGPSVGAAEPGPALYLLTDSSRLAYQQGDVLELNVVVKTPKELTLEKLSLVFHAADSEITIPAGSPGKVPAGSHTFSYRVDTRDLKPGTYSVRADLPPVGAVEKRIFIAPGTPKTHFKIAMYAYTPQIEKAAQWKQASDQYRFNLYWAWIEEQFLPKPIELNDYQAGLKDPLLAPRESMAQQVGTEVPPNRAPQWGFDLATRCGIEIYMGGLGQHQPLQNVDASWADPAVRGREGGHGVIRSAADAASPGPRAAPVGDGH